MVRGVARASGRPPSRGRRRRRCGRSRSGTGASSPQSVSKRVAVEAPRRRFEPRRVDEVRRADLGDPARSAPGARGRSCRPRPRGRGGCARAAGGGCRPSSRPARRRPSSSRGSVVAGPQSKSAGPSVGLDDVHADRALEPQEAEVDRREHVAQAPTRARARRRARPRGRRSGRRRPRSRPRGGRGSRGAANGASAVEAWVIRAGCSIRLSTPPSDSASGRASSGATSATASSSDSTRNETMPPKSRICRARDLVARVRRQARGRARARRPGARRGTRRSARAFSQCCRIRSASVLIPRSTSHESNGPGHGAERLLEEAQPLARAPGRSSRRSRRSRPSGRRGTSSSSGRRRRRRARAAAGGTARRTCCRPRGARRPRAPRRRPRRMSTTLSSGFDGVSTQTSRVSSSRCAARLSSNSSAGTYVKR